MNILLVYGGRSCEHDISIITACLAKGYFEGNIYSAYLSQNNVCYLAPNNFTPKQHKDTEFKYQVVFLLGKGKIGIVRNTKIKKIVKIDVVVNCCHGQSGEDGAIAGLCELADLPLVGSDVVSSAVAMDKIVTKSALAALKIPHIKGVGLCENYDADDIEKIEKIGYPIIVKPATLGSSIGISLCHNRAELETAVKTAFSYDKRVLCEKALENFYELNCAAMLTKNGLETSRVEKPYTTHDILTFQDKYQQGEKFVPPKSEVSEVLAERVKKLTEKIYRELGFSSVVRIDYLVDKDSGKLYVNEINSIPGSLSYGLWQHKYTPIQFGTLLYDQAVENYRKSAELNHQYASGVLDGIRGKK